MLRFIFRSLGILPYAQYVRLTYFPSPHQREESQFIQRRVEFYGKFLKPGQLCFDVGANIGNRTKVFLELGCSVVAVEPQPDCAKVLRLRFGNRIKTIVSALGREVGKGMLHISESSEISSLSDEWVQSVSQSRFTGMQWTRRREVAITTLDELIRQVGVPAFCKVDVEGFEEDVLIGLSVPIPMISIEYTLPEGIENLRRCLDRLHSLGDYLCNYTVGENMDFEELSWLSAEQLIHNIEQRMTKDMFGDVYVRFV